jgi:glutamate 5-kinase
VIREEVLEARVRELVRVRRQGHRPVLVSSGAIACGVGRLGIREASLTLPDLQAASAIGQGILYSRYARAFAGHDELAAQVLLTSADLERRASYLNARNTLARLLDLGAIPVVNENDTTATDEVTFGDNDVLAAQVAILLRATWLLLLTGHDGLYAAGPEGPQLLGDVPAGTAPDELALADLSSERPGRGGIESKVASASMATAAGVTCVIASGTAEGVIPHVASGSHVGTRFAPAERTESAFKLWLRHAKPAMGRVLVDAGAERALAGRGTSLLPVGVVGADGAFTAGDAVEVRSADGRRLVGKGISSLSVDEVRMIAGLKSADVRRRLPDAAEEVVHRDQFVLLADADSRRPLL